MKFIIICFILIIYTSCNNGTINTAPRMSNLIIKASTSAITGAQANQLYGNIYTEKAYNYLVANHPFGENSYSSYSSLRSAVTDTIKLDVNSFFKNCGSSLASCLPATPATAEWKKCHEDGYAMNGSSALEASCFIDSLFHYAKNEINKCKFSKGKDIDIKRYFPWDLAANWGIPNTANFQGASSSGSIVANEAYKYFRTKGKGVDQEQFILALEHTKGITIGYKNAKRKHFAFIWAKYSSGTANDYFVYAIIGNPDNNTFEAYKAYGSTGQTTRIISNGIFVYYQNWSTLNPGGSNPSTYACLGLADLSDATGACMGSFGFTNESSLNDNVFNLKVVDATGLNSGVRYDMSSSTYKVDDKLSGCF